MRMNKTVKLLIIALLGLSIIPIAIHPARAQVASPGFAVTSFATGFSTYTGCGQPDGSFAPCGPIGLAVDASGHLYVVNHADVPETLYKFGSSGGTVSSSSKLSALPTGSLGLAFTKDGRLYLTTNSSSTTGKVVEIDPSTGTVV